MNAQLYIVATPIGNLSDITLRAIEVLKSCDYIACEDTRVTRILAEKYSISAKLFDCHKFNEKERSEKIISLIDSGKTVALVSDAGTPLISDPGSVLIKELLTKNIKITAVPGVCAVTTFLSVLPRDNEKFAFIGFIPRNKKEQLDVLNSYKNTNCIFYEAPNRLIETLKNISDNFGPDTKISVGRELTKFYEEVKTDSVHNIIAYYETNTLKGEIVVMVYEKGEINSSREELKQKIALLKDENFSQKDIAKIISKLYGENKNKIYKLTLE